MAWAAAEPSGYSSVESSKESAVVRIHGRLILVNQDSLVPLAGRFGHVGRRTVNDVGCPVIALCLLPTSMSGKIGTEIVGITYDLRQLADGIQAASDREGEEEHDRQRAGNQRPAAGWRPFRH